MLRAHAMISYKDVLMKVQVCPWCEAMTAFGARRVRVMML